MGATRHKTHALLRAHLSAAASSGHATRRCAVCHRLQRLAMLQPQDPGESWAGLAQSQTSEGQADG